jgi:hypothetical protein
MIATLTLAKELFSALTEHETPALVFSVSLIMSLGVVQGALSIRGLSRLSIRLRVAEEAQFIQGETLLELVATREYFGMFHALCLSPATARSEGKRRRLSLIVGPGSAPPQDLLKLARYLSWRQFRGVETA